MYVKLHIYLAVRGKEVVVQSLENDETFTIPVAKARPMGESSVVGREIQNC